MKQNEILGIMYAAADKEYRDFNSALIPTVSKDCFIGVRTPKLREIARDVVRGGACQDFIAALPHRFFEENQLHAFIISSVRDFDLVVHAVDDFLPYVDNWATCDQMSPKVFAKNAEKLLPYIKKWIKSKHTYTVRFAILCLMRYFMDANFDKKYADLVLAVKSNEYYVNMMRAWYFATAAAKHFDEILPYFERLDSGTRARAIQKAIESYRVDVKHKLVLKSLKKKEMK